MDRQVALAAGFPLLLGAFLSLIFELVAWAVGKVRQAKVLNLFLGYLACTLPQGPPTIWAPILLVVSTIAYPAPPVPNHTKRRRATSRLSGPAVQQS